MGTYLGYFPIRDNEVGGADCCLSRKIKICCQSGADVALTRKSHRWVVLDVRPIGGVD
jgi:hypothetical protein